MSGLSNKELLILIGKSSFQITKNLCVKLSPSRATFAHWLLNLAFIFTNAVIMIGMAYLIVKSDPDLLTQFISDNIHSDKVVNSSSFWDILSATGSILAGSGTVALAYVAIKAAKGWQRDILFNKSLDQLFNVHIQTTELLNEYQDLFQSFILDWSKNADDPSILNGNVDLEKLRYELVATGAKMVFVTEKIKQRLDILKRIFEFDGKKNGAEHSDALFKYIASLNGEVMRASRCSPLKVFNADTSMKMRINDIKIKEITAKIHDLVLSYTQFKQP